MKNFKIILMAGLLAGVFSQTSLAAGTGSDPNDKPVEGAQVLTEGAGCTVCTKNAAGGSLTDVPADKRDQHRDLQPDGSTGVAPGKAEGGTQ